MTTTKTISRYWCPKAKTYTVILQIETDGTFTLTHNNHTRLGLSTEEARRRWLEAMEAAIK